MKDYRNRIGSVLHHGAVTATRRLAGLSTRTITVDGLPIALEERGRGRGDAIVMLHGFSSDRDAWTRFASSMRGYHLVIPDLIGHGQTPFIADADYSAPGQAKLVLALMDAIGIHSAHLLGHSMGGFVAATLARLAPERVLSLGLVAPSGVTSPQPSRLDCMLAQGHNPFLIEHAGQFDALYTMTMARPPYVPRLVRRSIAAEYVARRRQLEEIGAGIHERDALDEHLEEISAPAWILWGRGDQLVDASAAAVWKAGLPNSSLAIRNDLGHMPMLEDPRPTSREYMAFLRRLAAGSSAEPARSGALHLSSR
jgi:pimeloyl-ACP methyl ester carboxylesterase